MAQTDDVALRSVVAGVAPMNIAEVLAILNGIDAVTVEGDGIKWFNFLYTAVTEAVQQALQSAEGWHDRAGVIRLDVNFANHYFRALEAWVTPGRRSQTPAAWEPMFAARYDGRLVRLQLALAGMNAHINHDLVLALVQTFPTRGDGLRELSPQHDDFTRINAILQATQQVVEPQLLPTLLNKLPPDVKKLNDLLAMWSVRRAREAAWDNAEIYLALDAVPEFAAVFIDRLDHTVGFAGRGLLLPVI